MKATRAKKSTPRKTKRWAKDPAERCILGDRCQGCNRCLPPFVPLETQQRFVTVDADAVLILDERERDCINTMIDFFRSSGEDEHLDPEVYEGIAEKLGRKLVPIEQVGRAALPLLQRQLHEHTRALFELADDTVGLIKGIPDLNTAQGTLWKKAIDAFETCERVISGFIEEEDLDGRYDSWRDELLEENSERWTTQRLRSKR